MRVYILSSPEKGTVVEPERSVAAEETLAVRAISAGKSQTFTRKDLIALNTPVTSHVLEAGMNTVHCVPLMTSKGAVGALNIGSKQDHAFSPQDHELLNQVAAQLAIALENAQAYREISDLKNRLEEEKLYLESEIQTELHFEEIVGKSEVLKRVLTQVSTVAVSLATVLILGEIGTNYTWPAQDFLMKLNRTGETRTDRRGAEMVGPLIKRILEMEFDHGTDVRGYHALAGWGDRMGGGRDHRR